MIKLTRRFYNERTHFYEYEFIGEFKTYVSAIRSLNGVQDSFDKKCHRFKVNNDLYLMTK